MNFDSLHLNSNLTDRLFELGFKKATPIQEKAIPVIMQNKDLIGLAQTGTGKTAAFLLPLLHRLANQNKNDGGIKALIVTPTRELAEQIYQAAESFGQNQKTRCIVLYGGVSIDHQIKQLKNKVDLIIACPGRLLDHIARKTVRLAEIETLVLDEADQMLDMGFQKPIEKIISYLPAKRQTLLFSATMPKQIEKLANRILRAPVKIQTEPQSVKSQISHGLYKVAQAEKKVLLKSILDKKEDQSFLIFTRTKHKARQLAVHLVKSGYKASSLHGNLSVNQRKKAVEGFKKKTFEILVATDIAARGIDIPSISYVINFDIPNSSETYIHRLGRTGRANKVGNALTFATREDMKGIGLIEKGLRAKLPLMSDH